jgi:hypothetical protein
VIVTYFIGHRSKCRVFRGFPVRSEEHAFEVCDPVISGDRLSSMGRSTAGHGHPRVVLIASECNNKCNHRGRAGRDAIACRCANPTLEILSYGGVLA